MTDEEVPDPTRAEDTAADALAGTRAETGADAQTESPVPPVPPAPPVPASRRGRQTTSDMVRSLAVVVVAVGIIVGLNVARQPDPVVRFVEYPAALAAAQPGVGYPLAGPDPLPAGWRVTSARAGRDGAEGVTWHLGMVTDTEQYAAVEQSDGTRALLVRRQAAGGRVAGSTQIGGTTWMRLIGGDPGPRALLRESGGVQTMIVGTAPWSQLRQLASVLTTAATTTGS